MTAALKTFLALLVALPLAGLLGVQIGEGNYYPALVLGLVLGFVAALLLLGGGVRLEAFAVTLLICGYIIGGKGFAYLSLGGPLFVGEVVLATALLFWLARTVANREPLPRTAFTHPLLALVLYGGGHLLHDYPKFGLIAVRDSAVCYYIVFFLLGLSFSNHEASMDFLKRWIGRAILLFCFVVHPLTELTNIGERLTVRGVPIIYHNSDTLVSAYLMGGVLLYLLSRRQTSPLRSLLLTLASVGCVLYTAYLARSTYTICTVVLLAFLWAAAQRRFLAQIMAGLMILALVLAVGFSAGLFEMQGSRFEFARDKLVALTNPTREVETVADSTVAWRLAWWETVTQMAWEQNPVFGLGFGADISRQFFASLYGELNVTEEHLNTRSPHNVFFTMVARLGVVGVILFLWFCWTFVRQMFQAARLASRGLYDDRELLLWCLVLNNFVASFFSIILEGPTGAVAFWTLLGLLCGLTTHRLAALSPVPDAARPQPALPSSRQQPVAA